MAPIDYSRWDNIDSESEGEVVADSTRIQSRARPKETVIKQPPRPTKLEVEPRTIEKVPVTTAPAVVAEEGTETLERLIADLLHEGREAGRKRRGENIDDNADLPWTLESAVEAAHDLRLVRFPPPTPPIRSSFDPKERTSDASGLPLFDHVECDFNGLRRGQRLEDIPEIQLLPRSPEKEAAFAPVHKCRKQHRVSGRKKEPNQNEEGRKAVEHEEAVGAVEEERKGEGVVKEDKGTLTEEAPVKDEVEGSRVSFDDIKDRDFSPSGLVTEAESASTQYEHEQQLEELYYMLKAEKGLQHPMTLASFFKLFDVWIGLYRLRKCQQELEEILPVCRRLGDPFKLKAVQASAFTKWKQGRLKEALVLFQEMEQIVGKSAALCENIGHTYNSLGELAKAEQYFKDSLVIIEQQADNGRDPEGSDSNLGGVLLGLGIVLERRGRVKEALQFCKKAHKFYTEKFQLVGGSSLVAKAGMSVAKCYQKLDNLAKAQKYAEEAIAIFERTCGEDSPLVGSACHTLGKILWAKGKRTAARESLKRAYYLEAIKDAVDIRCLMEIHNELIETHTGGIEKINRMDFRNYTRIVEAATKNIQENVTQDGNAAVYYKLAAEMYLWGGLYGECVRMVEMAIPLFRAEKSMDCTCFVETCERMRAYAMTNVAMGCEVDEFGLRGDRDDSARPTEGQVTEQVEDSQRDIMGDGEFVMEQQLVTHERLPSSRGSEEFFDCEEDI